MNKFIEVMSVPVLSTVHLPSRSVVDGSLDRMLVAPYDGGWFLNVDLGSRDTDPDWFKPIRAWARRICPTCDWVRFDADAERICELKEFEW